MEACAIITKRSKIHIVGLAVGIEAVYIVQDRKLVIFILAITGGKTVTCDNLEHGTCAYWTCSSIKVIRKTTITGTPWCF